MEKKSLGRSMTPLNELVSVSVIGPWKLVRQY